METRTRSRRTVKTVDRGCLRGSGDTIAEAKADLNERIDAALEDNYDPAIITHGGYTTVVYRTPYGWEYRLTPVNDITDGITDVSGCSMLGNVSRKEALQSAAGHIVDIDGVDYHSAGEMPEWLTDDRRKRDIISGRRFQRAFRHFQAEQPGADHYLLHRMACDHSSEERFA